jgi:toxin FitB
VVEYLAVDTDVASHLQRGDLRDDLRVLAAGKIVCITFVTVGEFYKGAYSRGWSSRRIAELERWIHDVIVLPYDAEVSRHWGRLSAERQRVGQVISANDAWIAACCLGHAVPLMTLNRRHFLGIDGLVLVPQA